VDEMKIDKVTVL